MTTPASGNPISMYQIGNEVLVRFDVGESVNINEANVRSLLAKTTPSSQIALSDGYSRTWVSSGSWSTRASTSFTVPNRYRTITITIYGGGGGSGGGCGNDGFAYGYCGGCGGQGGTSVFYGPTNVGSYGGYGGCPGSTGGGGSGYNGSDVGTAGNGGSGCAGAGGGGTYIRKTFNYYDADAPRWGSTISVTIGSGGGGGNNGESACTGSAGGVGGCDISWSP
jgi:hypothetical protein